MPEKGVHPLHAPVRVRLQRLAGGGQLDGVGLRHHQPQPGPGGRHRQGAVQLDGHLRHRRGGPVQRPVRPDGSAGHRRGEVRQGLGGTKDEYPTH